MRTVRKAVKHSVLHVCDTVAEVMEGEAVEEADDHGDEEFAVEVEGGTP